MDEITIGLKVAKPEIPAKALMTIKQLTGLPFSEIKSHAENDEYIVEFPAYDDDGLRLINKPKRELKKLKVSTKLYEGDREESSQFFDNMEELYKEIDEYCENHPD